MRDFVAEVLTEVAAGPIGLVDLANRLGAPPPEVRRAMRTLKARRLAVCHVESRICRVTPTGAAVVRRGAHRPRPPMDWPQLKAHLEGQGWSIVKDSDGFVAVHRGRRGTAAAQTVAGLLRSIGDRV